MATIPLQVALRLVNKKGPYRDVPHTAAQVDETESACSSDDAPVEMNKHVIIAENSDTRKRGINPSESSLSPPTVHLMVFIPDGIKLVLKNLSRNAPNSYITCKGFCCGHPPPNTDVVWSCNDPLYNFRLIYPLILCETLMSKLQNGVMVIEVWHKSPNTTEENQV